MTNIQDILNDIERIEPFPMAAIRVLELSLAGAEPVDVVRVISQDPGLTAKILKLANSAQFAPKVPIESILHATNRLGSKTIASLAMTTGCASFFMGYGSSSSRSNRWLWEECMHTAFSARRLSGLMGYSNPELAYTLGLLQNIGHMVLDRFMNPLRDKVLELVEGGLPVWVAEQRVIGMDHTSCGERIVRRWGFPDSFVQGIRYHHDPLEAGDYHDLCCVAEAAEAITTIALHDTGVSMLDRSLTSPLSKHSLAATEMLKLLNLVREDLVDTDLALT